MQFDYSQYFKILVWGSIFFAVFILSIMLINTIRFLIAMNKCDNEEEKKKIFGNMMCGCIFAIAFALFISVPSFKHGVHLFTEKEDSAIVETGTITSIKGTFGNNKYSYEDKHNVFASYVYIDGEQYYIMFIGDFKIGDEVTIEYLPKSRIILSIDYAEVE